MRSSVPGGPARLLISLILTVVAGCTSADPADPQNREVEVVIPEGALMSETTDSLYAAGLLRWKLGFRVLARLRGDDREVRFGRYRLPDDYSWGEVLDRLTRGAVATVELTVPEGLTLLEIAKLIATVSSDDEDKVAELLSDTAWAEELGLPSTGFEGYLFPDTYRFADGVPSERVITEMLRRHEEVWTEERLARIDSMEMSRHEVVTIASIIQAEAAQVDEMPRISSVFHNRLREGWLLQADPTVMYALGGRRPRLFHAAIDSVASHPYNTYTQPGLPPGPINAPGEAAISAALWPADEDYWFFVAGRNGYHIFSRTLAEHQAAIRALTGGGNQDE